jgi:protein-disulfide isomerase
VKYDARGGDLTVASGSEDRERLRAEREAKAASQAARERRNRRLWQLGATLVVAAALVGAAIAISNAGKHKAVAPAKTQALFAGIPQQGIVLGNPSAPLTMMEFADLQCPICREYTVTVFPALVRRYVRAGRMKIVLEDLAFLGDDSVKAGVAAGAAGLQNKLWNFAERFYQEQGVENSGYATDAFVRHIAMGVPGLDAARLLADRTKPAVLQQIQQARAQAKALGVSDTPRFFLQRGGGKPSELQYSSFDVSQFSRAIDAALGSG